MPSSPPVVLIVDPQQESLAMYALSLLAMGFVPITAGSADDAFDRACRHDPDIVVTDIPDVNGACVPLMRRLRQDVRTRSASIIVISDSHAAEQSECRALCDHVVVKPCLPDELCRQIMALLAA